MNKKFLILTIFFSSLLVPASLVLAGDNFNFSAWLPYWKKNLAQEETLKNLKKINTLLPFSYEVDKQGKIKDPMRLKMEPWTTILPRARSSGVKIVPSILWNDGLAMEKVFSTQKDRGAHIEQIMTLVKENNFDGIDIDYENKPVTVYRTFGAFLRSLSLELHKQGKILSCTIEPRLPPESRFLVVPEKISYANDYEIINQYCDEVRIMAYDQGRADIKLNQLAKGSLYAPVADARFVEKVINFTSKQISKKKLIIGVANYGYEYQVIDKNKYYDYKKLRSLSEESFWALAQERGMTPVRDLAGELSFIYQATSSPSASATRLVVLSDTEAQIAKIKLAKKMGVKGVSLFRLSGESKEAFWQQIN